MISCNLQLIEGGAAYYYRYFIYWVDEFNFFVLVILTDQREKLISCGLSSAKWNPAVVWVVSRTSDRKNVLSKPSNIFFGLRWVKVEE